MVSTMDKIFSGSNTDLRRALISHAESNLQQNLTSIKANENYNYTYLTALVVRRI